MSLHPIRDAIAVHVSDAWVQLRQAAPHRKAEAGFPMRGCRMVANVHGRGLDVLRESKMRRRASGGRVEAGEDKFCLEGGADLIQDRLSVDGTLGHR